MAAPDFSRAGCGGHPRKMLRNSTVASGAPDLTNPQPLPAPYPGRIFFPASSTLCSRAMLKAVAKACL